MPSNDCLITTVNLPTRQRRQQLKAIPFVLEEQLAVDIETMHFAVGKRSESGQIQVIAVSKSKMIHWADILNEAGIAATSALATCIKQSSGK